MVEWIKNPTAVASVAVEVQVCSQPMNFHMLPVWPLQKKLISYVTIAVSFKYWPIKTKATFALL